MELLLAVVSIITLGFFVTMGIIMVAVGLLVFKESGANTVGVAESGFFFCSVYMHPCIP